MTIRKCRCGYAFVTFTDIAYRSRGMLVVHGLWHCYEMPPCRP